MNRLTFDRSAARRFVNDVVRFAAEDRGDDLIEYALLTTFIGMTGYLAFTWLSHAIKGSYTSWDAGQQKIFQPPDPAS